MHLIKNFKTVLIIACFIGINHDAHSVVKKGFYAGLAVGGSFLQGKRSDTHLSVAPPPTLFQVTKNKGIQGSKERGQIFAGFFMPTPGQRMGLGLEGSYTFGKLNHVARGDITEGQNIDTREDLALTRSWGGVVKAGPLIGDHQFVNFIFGFEASRFTRFHEDAADQQYQKVAKTKTGIQYGLGYQYAWSCVAVGIELRQTRYGSTTLKSLDSTNAVSTTRFKPKVNTVMLRLVYRFN